LELKEEAKNRNKTTGTNCTEKRNRYIATPSQLRINKNVKSSFFRMCP